MNEWLEWPVVYPVAAVTVLLALAAVVFWKRLALLRGLRAVRQRAGMPYWKLAAYLVVSLLGLGFALLWLALLGVLVTGLFGLIREIMQTGLPANPETLPADERTAARAEVWNFRFLLARTVALATVLGGVIALPITLTRLPRPKANARPPVCRLRDPARVLRPGAPACFATPPAIAG